MPRGAVWEGSIGFGLVNVPVAMVRATRDLGFHFRELHAADGAPVRHRRYCAAEDVEVPADEIGRGFELDDGGMVVLTDEDLESVEPERTRTIEIESFTSLDEIDPIRFDHPYFLVPKGKSGGTLRAYRLLVEAMRSTERVALGRFVMRTKEYLAAVREHDGALALSTLRYADEIRPVDAIPIEAPDEPPAKKAVRNAIAVITELGAEWEPERFEDLHRARLAEVIEERRKGHTVAAPEPADDEPTPAPDLIAALRETLEESRKPGRKRKRSRRAAAPKAKPSSGKRKPTAGKGKPAARKDGGKQVKGSSAKRR